MKTDLQRLQGTKTLAMVQFAGTEGKRFTELQRFIVEMNGKDYDRFEDYPTYAPRVDSYGNWVRTGVVTKRYNRGYWTVGIMNAKRRGYIYKDNFSGLYFANKSLLQG